MPLDPQLDPVFDAAGQIYNVDPTHLKAIALAESAGDPGAVSRKGATGLMQLMPDTAKKLGVTNLEDPTESILGGAKYYSQGLDKYGSPATALMAYHGGIGNEQAWGTETQAYPGKVAAAYAKLQQSPKLAGTQMAGDVVPFSGPSPSPWRGRGSGLGGFPDEQEWRDLGLIGNEPTKSPMDFTAPGLQLGVPANEANRQPATRPVQVAQNTALTGTDALAAVGKPQTQVAQAGGMSDEDLINGFVNGTLPFLPKPGAQPATAPQAAAPQGASPISQEAITWAQQQARTNAALGRQTPEYINSLANMAPGLPGSPQYEQQKAAATKAGGNLQTIGPGGVVSNMPGAVESDAAKAGAVAGAQQEQKIEITRDGGIYKGGVYIGHAPKMTDVVDAQGNKYPAFTPPIGQVAPGLAPPSAPGASANLPAGAAPPPGAVMGSPSELGPAAHAELGQTGKEVAEQRQANIDHAQTAQTQNALINRMKLDVGNFPQGPLGPKQSEFQSYLRYFNPTYNEPTATAEEFNKNAGIILRQAVHETSSRAAVQEYNLIGKTLPAQSNSPMGTIRVLNEFQGLNDYIITKNQAQGAWLQSHNNSAQGFETDWQSKVSPDAFILHRMTPQDQQSTILQLQKTDDGRATLKTLAGQMQYLKATGLEKALQ